MLWPYSNEPGPEAPTARSTDPLHLGRRAPRRRPEAWTPSRHAAPRPAVRGALAAASRGDFRVVHFSVQRDHVHLLVEAKDRQVLSRGMRGLAIRVALALNRVLAPKGRVWADRWHARALSSPRQVRAALVYVLMNFRKHGAECPSIVDRCSSARWLDGWMDWRPPRAWPFGRRDDERPTAVPRTWLLGHGWRRHGLLSVAERPGPG